MKAAILAAALVVATGEARAQDTSNYVTALTEMPCGDVLSSGDVTLMGYYNSFMAGLSLAWVAAEAGSPAAADVSDVSAAMWKEIAAECVTSGQTPSVQAIAIKVMSSGAFGRDPG